MFKYKKIILIIMLVYENFHIKNEKGYFQVGLEDFSSKPLHGGVLLITLTFFLYIMWFV